MKNINFYKLKISIYCIFFFIPLFSGCHLLTPEKETKAELTKTWVTFKYDEDYDRHFSDLKEHGVRGITVNRPSKDLLKFARKYDLKIGISVPEITEKAYLLDSSTVERAVMIGGAYQGLAIDRHLFSFSAEKHKIRIENPVYDTVDCYKTLGHYFPGMHDPLKAEIIVKEKKFDGKQHLRIIPASVGDKINEHLWEIEFDLSGVKGDLDHVQIAVYWISEGTRDYWMFGDAASAAAKATRKELKNQIEKIANEWKEINGGKFPKEIEIVRFGDECFHVSGHMNCKACSYPMWDFSEAGLEDYKAMTSLEYPRGKTFIDFYGREAYAIWLYNYHKTMADLVDIVKDGFSDAGAENILVYRNITRFNTYHTLNDIDGSGLDLLSRKLDIVHIDPYPINANGYLNEVIPGDMAYVAGLAYKYQKPLMPWLQAHQYWPEYGGLTHPEPHHIKKMVEQHMVYSPDALMWLGYGKPPFSTFPEENPESWKMAGEMNYKFLTRDFERKTPDIAIIRPYNVRALRDADSLFINDVFLTDVILSRISVVHPDWITIPYEPLSIETLKLEKTADYKAVIASTGILSRNELNPVLDLDIPAFLLIAEADRYNIDKKLTGIAEYVKTHHRIKAPVADSIIEFDKIDEYKLDDSVEVILSFENIPLVWKKNKAYFISFAGSNEKLYGIIDSLISL